MNRTKQLLLILLSSLWLAGSAHSSESAPIDQLLSQEDSIIGLEAIVAAGSNDAFYSRFGHAMLRFVKADGVFATDSVLSLEANVADTNIDAMKGLFGGYTIAPTIQSLGDFWQEYVQTEERPLNRYVVLSTPVLRHKLLLELKAWYENPSLSGNYTFLKNNCVGALAKLLDDSGFPAAIGMYPIIPTDFNDWLSHSLLSPFPPTQMQSPKAVFTKLSQIVKIPLINLGSNSNWPANSADLIQANLSDLEIKQLLLELPQMPQPIRQALVKDHNFSNGGATLNQVMTYKPIPRTLYSPCATQACAADIISTAQTLWSQEEWSDAMHGDEFSFWLAFGDRNQEDNDPVATAKDGYAIDPSQATKCILRAPEMTLSYQLMLRSWAKL